MIITVFIIGYLLIALEEYIKISKSAIALITGVVCWTLLVFAHPDSNVPHQLINHLGEVAGILFFLIGAMTIVEIIDAYNGFDVLTQRIRTKSKKTIAFILILLTFFLSSVLDNLTTTIVIISIVLKIIQDSRDRAIFSSLVVVAANAGGAWSPIGDVTTTMLWIGNQITTTAIIKNTFLACLISVTIPTIALLIQLKGTVEPWIDHQQPLASKNSKQSILFFYVGISSFLCVPIFKSATGLPPYMGMLLSLGMVWLLSEIIDRDKDEEEKHHTSINHLLKKIDTPSILFFLGILLAVGALSTAGILNQFSNLINTLTNDFHYTTMLLGVSSAIVDNIPLMAAAQRMYDLNVFATDHPFWMMLAYTTGTGGSLLIIGSAAGVAAMGMTKIKFVWYLKKVCPWVLLGYIAGWLFLSMTLL